MKKILILALLAMFAVSCVWAEENMIEINGVDFDIPNKYLGGDEVKNGYKLDNNFSIRCIDDDIGDAIGLWAEENEFEEDLEIGNHPVKHYCQHNKYVNGDHSHAYFVSGDSFYEIAWVGKLINSDIEKLINNTPDSNIDEDDFADILDSSLKTYKQDKINKLNNDAEYNYLESKISSQNHAAEQDDTRFNEILLTRYNRY